MLNNIKEKIAPWKILQINGCLDDTNSPTAMSTTIEKWDEPLHGQPMDSYVSKVVRQEIVIDHVIDHVECCCNIEQ